MKSKLFFDHIPKSAGTSISNALEDIFSEKNLISEFNNQHAYTIKTYRESNFLGGHIWFRQYEQLDSERYYCTILRDPIDRFLSQYSFHRQIAASLTNEGPTKDLRLGDPQVLAATGMDIKEYILSPIPALINSYSNVQARHFAQRYCQQPRPEQDPDQRIVDLPPEEPEHSIFLLFPNLIGAIDVQPLPCLHDGKPCLTGL